MSGRPEILFPLFSELTTLPGIGKKSASLLNQLGVEVPTHLLFTLPQSVIDRRLRESVLDIPEGATGSVEVTITAHHPPRRKGLPYRVTVDDGKTAFQLVFFHSNTHWLKRQLPEGARRIVSGRVEYYDSMRQIPHPDYILPPEEGHTLAEFEPVYPLTSGLSLKTITKAVNGALKRIPSLDDWIDPTLKGRKLWPSWSEAITLAHSPQSSEDLLLTSPARLRLAYDEFFAHQVTLALARAARRQRPGRKTQATGKLSELVRRALPYLPTAAQDRAVAEILSDMSSPMRMNRLLQGDVGAGKTLVALLAATAAVEAGGQAVIMAPTEILARQHLAGIEQLAAPAHMVVTALTGRDRGAERQKKLDALAQGNIDILVGTHAVFQKHVVFHDLRLAVVDEQHRFGVAQRMQLGEKGTSTDVLVMTATPIPRSLSLAQYGDMDVSILDEKPPGRSPISTALVSSKRMDEVIAHLKSAIAEGRQAFWVCPLVEESEVSDMTAAEERFKSLRAAFGEGTVGLIHGQMSPADKDAAMEAFVSGAIRILVATTVIEVGVDVPNATIMVIERAESFGLAQVHQLRGRVGRGAGESTCLLLYQAPLSEHARRRLEVLRETEDGFRIAEEDLALRGAGDVLGKVQAGLPQFRIADLERQASLMAIAQDDARALLARDPDLTSRRGKATRVLLWLLERDQAIRLISVG